MREATQAICPSHGPAKARGVMAGKRHTEVATGCSMSRRQGGRRMMMVMMNCAASNAKLGPANCRGTTGVRRGEA